MKRIFILSTVLLLHCFTVRSQEIQSPAPGKSVVYFVRPSGLGLLINFTYYDSAKFIGKFNGPKYMRYECSPGKHLFWATSENRDFVEAELEEGKIYFIEAVPQMGAVKAGVQLVPLNPNDPKRMKKIHKLMNKKTSETFTEAELEQETRKSRASIESGLERYQKLKANNNRNISILKKEDNLTR